MTNTIPVRRLRRVPVAVAAALLCAAAVARDAPPPPTAPAAPSPPAGAAAAPSAAAPPAAAAPARPANAAPAAPAPAPAAAGRPATPVQQVEITGGRTSDTEQRRQSTAAKIVIGREEIDKFGDATVGEVLRRLPGVTTPGPPGRGGPPRMRGLGGGFTQLLIDGQRVPPGFSLESISPDQIDRIEILRAPTAETGARAIAGTINIITREGFRRRLNDLRIGLSTENGRVTPGAFWTHNDSAGPLTYNLSAGMFRNQRRDESSAAVTDTDLGSGALLRREESQAVADQRRLGLNLGARLQWRLGEGGDSLVLAPSVFHADTQTRREETRRLAFPGAPDLPLYDRASSDGDSRFTNARLQGQWRQRLTPALRMELSGTGGSFSSRNDGTRLELRNGQAAPLRRLEDDASTREHSANLTLKFTGTLGGTPERPGSEHSLVTGLELEAVRRSESRSTLQDGAPLLPGFGTDLKASSLRSAAYVQDEWSLNPKWALHGGLRWEGIHTEGDAAQPGTPRPSNRSSVWTPLGHLLYKPDPAKRDQVRLSLTRSYRSPALASLIAKPAINSRFPVAAPNDPTAPDTVGNPGLRPELATGIDLAFERYLQGGGVLSVNLFHRRITDLTRSVVALETVAWSPVPRWVSRPQNIGQATTQGVELEARFRLDQLVTDAPRVELRSNLSLFRSRVDGIPGPDNRLDQQAPGTANLGADYRVRGTKFTLGGNVNLVPGYRTQQAADRATELNRKRVFDAYVLYAINPATALRFTASNLAPLDTVSSNSVDYRSGTRLLRETSTGTDASHTNWQLRLELKL